MNRDLKTWLLLAIKNPIGALVIGIVLSIIFVMYTIIAFDSESNTNSGGTSFCTEGEINTEKFMAQFENAGAFTGMGETFIEVAKDNNIDPVLLSAIALLETGRGTSVMVTERNNPGGLFNSRTGTYFVFDSLDEGIFFMAKNLYKLYYAMGLVSIEDIGNKYAPIGAENDPKNLNQYWIPSVTNMANELGGLSMNCSLVGSGDFIYPLKKVEMTSPFGYRRDPVTGAPAEFHKGLDFDCETGDPVYASKSGKIQVAVHSGWGGGYGHHVVINHGGKYSLYGHMTTVIVDANDDVQQGQQIGTCGTTGSSTGTHVHFEIQGSFYGDHEDPKLYLGLGSKKE